MESMNNEPLHDAIIARIIDLYESGNDPLDIHDHLGSRVSLDEIKSTLSDYETSMETLQSLGVLDEIFGMGMF